jgi:hypothetical protein
MFRRLNTDSTEEWDEEVDEEVEFGSGGDPGGTLDDVNSRKRYDLM